MFLLFARYWIKQLGQKEVLIIPLSKNDSFQSMINLAQATGRDPRSPIFLPDVREIVAILKKKNKNPTLSDIDLDNVKTGLTNEVEEAQILTVAQDILNEAKIAIGQSPTEDSSLEELSQVPNLVAQLGMDAATGVINVQQKVTELASNKVADVTKASQPGEQIAVSVGINPNNNDTSGAAILGVDKIEGNALESLNDGLQDTAKPAADTSTGSNLAGPVGAGIGALLGSGTY